MRCAPRGTNGPDHLGMCALQALERQTQLILNCPVYKSLVLPEVGGILAVSLPTGQPGRVLHPGLKARLQVSHDLQLQSLWRISTAAVG